MECPILAACTPIHLSKQLRYYFSHCVVLNEVAMRERFFILPDIEPKRG